MFATILIYVVVRYLQQLAPKQSQALAFVGLLLTVLYVAFGWPSLPAR